MIQPRAEQVFEIITKKNQINIQTLHIRSIQKLENLSELSTKTEIKLAAGKP